MSITAFSALLIVKCVTMFLVFCEEDHSYLIVQENKAIFEDSVKKGDEIRFYHCNKIYVGHIIGRSDDEKKLTMLRKQTIEKDKETAKASKPVCEYSPKETKRQRVRSVRYSPLLYSEKKTVPHKKRKARNKINKDKDNYASNTKTQQLNSVFSSSSEEPFSDEDKSKNSDDSCKENTVTSDLTQHQSTAAHTSTIAALLKRLKEAETKNSRLQTLLKEKRALSPLSSSGIESLTDTVDNENIHAKFENREHNTVSQQKPHRDQDTHVNITLPLNSCEPPFANSQNDTVLEHESNENTVQNVQKYLPEAPRQLHQLYGKDFDEDGETMVLLADNVFCKSSVMHYALGSSTKTTHLVRKLVLGVFRKEIFKKGYNQVTLTGNAPRSVGKLPGAKYYNIDVRARSAIIKYAKAIGKLKKWPYVRTKDLDRALSQRIGEVKREVSIE